MPSLPELAVKVAGRDAATNLLEMIAKVEVDASRGQPASFTLRLEGSSARDVLVAVDGHVGRSLAPGTEIEIARATDGSRVPVLVGIVDAVGLDLDSGRTGRSPAILVTGYDRAHLLKREEKIRTFSDVRPSEVAALIASEYDLKSKTQTSPVAAHLLQSGLTDWDFLLLLAERIGFDVFVAGDTLHFEAHGIRGRSKIKWGSGLTQFSPKITRSRQIVDVTVRGWDPGSKQVVTGVGTVGGGGSEGLIRHIGDRLVRTTDEADHVARSIASAVGRGAKTGSGLVRPGQPEIMPGVIVEIVGVGTEFGGDCYVGAATHRFTAQGYTTTFEIGDPVASDNSALDHAQRIDLRPSVAAGIVTDNEDPEGLGRVRIVFPWLSKDDPSSWARLAAPMAGPERGAYFLPEVGDEVLAAFEHGDIRAPFVVGALWNGVDRPPEENTGGANNVRLLRSRSGHEIRFDDSLDAGGIEIATRNGQTIRLDNDSDRIEIVGGAGGSTILIDTNTGDIELRTTGSSGGTIKLESAGDLKLKAARSITLEAGLNLIANAGVQVSVEGNAGAELRSGGIVEVAGSLVRIN